jgi:hypothetical protein
MATPSLTDFDDEERVVVAATLIIINIHSGDCLVPLYCAGWLAGWPTNKLPFFVRCPPAIIKGNFTKDTTRLLWWTFPVVLLFPVGPSHYYYYDYYSPFLFLFLISVQRASW